QGDDALVVALVTNHVLAHVSSIPSSRSDALDDGGDAHATADAQGGDAALEVTALELVDERAEDHRAGGTERVTHGDGAAVDVGLLLAPAHVAQQLQGD